MLIRLICLLVLVGIASCPGCWGSVVPDEEQPVLRKELNPLTKDLDELLKTRFRDVILNAKAKVFPALVFVKPVREDYSGGEKRSLQIFGSGVIVDPAGFVVTNNHVAEKAKRIKCVLATKEEIPATVVGLDKETDIAVLKLDLAALEKIRRHTGQLKDGGKLELPFAGFGDSLKLTEGDYVMAMGSPFGFSRSISVGVVSCAERYLEGDEQPFTLWVQTDAAINPGNSGGPLVNAKGEIIGINSRKILFGDNIGFAIPSALVRPVYEELRKNHSIARAWTGIKFQSLEDFAKDTAAAPNHGVIVASVEPGSPGEKCGLMAGDLIFGLNGQTVNALYKKELPALRMAFANLPIEKAAKLDVERGEEKLEITFTPNERGESEGDDFECKKWKMTVKEISKLADPEMAFYRPKGVFIQGVKSGGAAQAAQLIPGDIIVKIEDKEITSLSELKQVYEELITRPIDERIVHFLVQRQAYVHNVILDYRKQDKEDEEDEK
ncbi:MAG: trypsin-like peptidase domain-containing protein [Planctomycetota bacterium]|jgi:serine protease Do